MPSVAQHNTAWHHVALHGSLAGMLVSGTHTQLRLPPDCIATSANNGSNEPCSMQVLLPGAQQTLVMPRVALTPQSER